VELATERLRLREFVEADWPAVLAYQRDSRYLRYNPWTARNAQEVQAFVRRFVDQQGASPRTKYQLAVTLQDGGALIGNCGIRQEAAGASEADIGYELAPEHWGHGYATEAAGAVLRFGFEVLEVHRVSAWCVADNAASVRVLEKLGLREEGRLREKSHYKGRWWDHLLFAILAEEWQAQARPGDGSG
jgi:RimJ/RimL family protein N-acetyltransferase